jgi:hypothetical protein
MAEPNTPKEFAWVGRELIRILNTAYDGTVRDLFTLLQDRGGPKLLGDLMNALRDCDVTTLPKVTRAVTPERKEALAANLVKAREAKKAKTSCQCNKPCTSTNGVCNSCGLKG